MRNGAPSPKPSPCGGSDLGRGPALAGWVPFSSVDWPGRLAAVAFLRGCAWRCGYCHNPLLQSLEGGADAGWGAFLAWLETRRGLLEAVVFSGGEPTLQPGLPEALRRVGGLGFQLGLHSAGMDPPRLKVVLPALAWIGLDIKAPWGAYGRLTGHPGSATLARQSLRAVLESGVPYEVRTTYHPLYLNLEELRELSLELQALNVRQWVVQKARLPAGDPDFGLPAGLPGLQPCTRGFDAAEASST